MILDPQRRIDPKNGLSYSGRTYEQLLQDVIFEYKRCLNMFIDVPEGHYSEEAIYRLKKNGIIVGFEDGSFGFGKSLTREDFAVIIDRILQKQCWYKDWHSPWLKSGGVSNDILQNILTHSLNKRPPNHGSILSWQI